MILQEESSREAGDRDDEDLWADRVTYLVEQAKWATGYMHNDASYVDLSGADLFEDTEKNEEEKARRQQQQLWKKRSSSGKSEMGSENGSEKEEDEKEEEEAEEDGEVGDIATLLRRAKIKQKAKDQSKEGRNGERRMAFIGSTRGKVLPLFDYESIIPAEDNGINTDEATAIQQGGNNDVFSAATFTITATTEAAKDSTKAPGASTTRRPNSLFSSGNKQKQRLTMTQKGSTSKSATSEGFEDTLQSDTGSSSAAGKRPTFRKTSKVGSQKASKRSTGDAPANATETAAENVADGDINDDEGGDEASGEEGMSKAKMLQLRKKKQQTDAPKIAKRLTAKEKRALETAKGRPGTYKGQYYTQNDVYLTAFLLSHRSGRAMDCFRRGTNSSKTARRSNGSCRLGLGGIGVEGDDGPHHGEGLLPTRAHLRDHGLYSSRSGSQEEAGTYRLEWFKCYVKE